MKSFSPIVLLVLVFASSVFSQDTKTSRADANDVVRISTNLIQLDVTVTDKNGKPITDLRQDEVEVFENGRKKNITHFQFSAGTRTIPPESKNRKNPASKPPVLPSGPMREEAVRRSVAIVVDDLSLSFASALWTKEALKKFISENLQVGDLVAIFRTGVGVGVLQQFTADRRQLLAAVERLRYNHHASTSFLKEIRSIGDAGQSPDEREKERQYDQLRTDSLAQGTIGFLSSVVRGMGDLPGRKSVVLLSDGLNLRQMDSTGRAQFSLNYYPLRRLIDLANRSSVTFYSMHAPGLIAPGVTAADDVVDVALAGGERRTDGIIMGRLQFVRESQEGLIFVAEHTGGFALINNNDLGRGLRRAMDDQSYYLVAYDPDDETFDPRRLKYNKFEVKVNRPGARVRYRSGFLSVSEEQTERWQLSTADTIIKALISPFTTNEIDVRMNAIFVADAKINSAVKSFINVDPSGLTFSQQNGGLRKTSFDIVAFTFGMDGEVIDRRSRNFTVTVTPDQYETMRKRGLVAAFDLPVKSSGGYQVRLAVRDVASGRLGSAYQFVEVPPVKNGKLWLSGMVLASDSMSGAAASEGVALEREDPLRYTSVREFKTGTPLHFTYFVYNSKLDRDQKPAIIQSYRLFKDNQLVFSSPERQVAVDVLPNSKIVPVSGGIMLGDELLPGDYVIEVVVKDGLVQKRSATQFIQFEIVT